MMHRCYNAAWASRAMQKQKRFRGAGYSDLAGTLRSCRGGRCAVPTLFTMHKTISS